MSSNPVFFNVCHTAQNSPMYVTQPRILQCISHGLVVRDGAHFCLLFLAVNHSKAGNKLGLGVGLVLGLGIRSGIVLGIRLGLGLGLVLGLGVF